MRRTHALRLRRDRRPAHLGGNLETGAESYRLAHADQENLAVAADRAVS